MWLSIDTGHQFIILRVPSEPCVTSKMTITFTLPLSPSLFLFLSFSLKSLQFFIQPFSPDTDTRLMRGWSKLFLTDQTDLSICFVTLFLATTVSLNLRNFTTTSVTFCWFHFSILFARNVTRLLLLHRSIEIFLFSLSSTRFMST